MSDELQFVVSLDTGTIDKLKFVGHSFIGGQMLRCGNCKEKIEGHKG
jgi:hypothetical protein